MDFKYIDTHAHLNLSAFAEDFDGVSKSCAEAGVAVINVGTNEKTSKRGVELAEKYTNQYAIIGLHPIQTVPGMHDGEDSSKSKGEEFNKDFYRELDKSKKVVGIGECGFDYYHTPEGSFEIQEKAFIEQIELANELSLPLMIHTRGPKPGKESPTGRSVYADVYDTLKQYAKVPFNVHFYAGTISEAEKFLEIGGTISFTGVITFAKDYEEVVKWAPLDRIHAETDSPFVSPVPHRGKRCEPHYVIEVYKKIAELKGLEEEDVRMRLLKNAKTFYQI